MPRKRLTRISLPLTINEREALRAWGHDRSPDMEAREYLRQWLREELIREGYLSALGTLKKKTTDYLDTLT